MFSGIIEELGEVVRILKKSKHTLLGIKVSSLFKDCQKGESVSVNGVCLTLINNIWPILEFEVMPETLKRTNLAFLKISDKVNLEHALKVGERVSGHFVSGHVDCIGLVRKRYYFQENLCFDISVPHNYAKYLIPKGSIAVDGISLTIARITGALFSVYLISHTLNNTTLKFRFPSSRVNIEFDILAKR